MAELSILICDAAFVALVIWLERDYRRAVNGS